MSTLTKSIHSKRQKQLCAALREAREQAKLTQEQIAKRLGTYKTYVTKYENGDLRLDVIEFLAVAEALRIDPAELLRKVKA